jgi:hypothetical protein
MKYIECPATFEAGDHQYVSVFMGGGISSCPDWQTEMKNLLEPNPKILLVNPRRSNFDVSNENMAVEQIHWEHDHLHNVNAIMFWFPKETLCPITLFELGVHASRHSNVIFVGCHPEYQRKLDVEVQLSLIRPDVFVHDNLASLASEITIWTNWVTGLRLE